MLWRSGPRVTRRDEYITDRAWYRTKRRASEPLHLGMTENSQGNTCGYDRKEEIFWTYIGSSDLQACVGVKK